MANITYRLANKQDVLLYYNWANDKIVRQNAINPEHIQLENHRNWFTNRINNPFTLMYLFEIEKKPFGQIRFDMKEGTALIDYSIDINFRGKKLGYSILKLALEIFEQNEIYQQINEVVGVVKAVNIPSLKIFESLGFQIISKEIINEEEYFKFSKQVST